MEKLTIRAHGYSLGQTRVYVPNEIIDDPIRMESALNLRLAPEEKKRDRKAYLAIDYGKVTLSLDLKEVDGLKAWQVTYVTVNLPRCLYGHNAKLIITQDQLWTALSIANETINACIRPEDEDLLIPSLLPNSRSYFTYLEIANQVSDPGSIILEALKHARIPHYDADNEAYDDTKVSGGTETMYIGSSSQPLICAYRKDKEVTQKKRRDAADNSKSRWFLGVDGNECLRFETRLRGRKMINTILDDSKAYDDGHRLTSFTIEGAFDAYEKTVRDIRGVFHDPDNLYAPAKTFKEITQELIKELSDSRSTPPLYKLLQKVKKDKNYSDASIAVIRANLESWICSQSKVQINQLLPYSDECNVMNLTPMKRCENSNALRPIFMSHPNCSNYDMRIAEAYSALSILNIKGLIPQSKMPWMPGY